jgi:hypothetical protein
MDNFMKTSNFQKSILAVAIGLAFSAMTVVAQDSATSQPAPTQLSYGASQIVLLAHAKVSDDTIIAYIHNSGNSYVLDADQIIYLRQQGISDAVVNVMLNQPRNAPAATAPQQNNSSYTSSAQTATAVAQPTTTYVASTPSSTVYVIPDTQTYYYDSGYYQPYYYPYYAWPYAPVSLSFGFGGRWGGGWHGGGFHSGGGSFHSGGSHGGFHH